MNIQLFILAVNTSWYLMLFTKPLLTFIAIGNFFSFYFSSVTNLA